MKRLFSAKGLAIAAAVLILLIFVGASLIDGIIKHQIETHGTKTVGARVDLAAADLSFFPPGLELTGLDITDPGAPMTNAVSIKRIQFAVGLLQLLKKEIVVEDMAVTGIRFNTSRKTSGAVPGHTLPAPAQKDTSGCKTLSLPPLKMPDIEDILGKENLQSERYLRKLRDDMDAQKRRWTRQLASLPGPAAFDNYRKRIEKFGAGSSTAGFGALLSAPAELQNLQRDIEKDLNRLKNAQADLERNLKALQNDAAHTGRKISADATRLARKYAISGDGLQNISRALFGGAFCGWLTRSSGWYDRARGRTGDPGSDQKTPGETAAPDAAYFVWVKNAVTRVEFGKSSVNGTIRNISNQPARAGVPMTMVFEGTGIGALKSINVNGVIDLLDPKSPKMNLNGLLRGLQITDFDIPGDMAIPVTITTALADLKFDTKLIGDSIQALAEAGLTQVTLNTGSAAGDDPLADAIVSALSGISAFTAFADASGTLSAYDIRIRSDMDKAIGRSAEKIVAGQMATLKNSLDAAITARLSGPRAEAATDLKGFGSIQKEIETRLNLGDGLLKNAGLPF